MQGREKTVTIAVVLTVADIAVVNIYFGAIWRAWGLNPWANAAPFALLAVWLAAATVLWIHISNDAHRLLRECAMALPSDPRSDSSELRRNNDV
jgi:hypothetical protein